MEERKWSHRIDEFFKSEYIRLTSYVRKLIDDAADRDAEDVVQEVMTHIFSRPDDWVDNLSAYVYRSLRYKTIDLIRKRKNVMSIDEEFKNTNGLSLAGLLKDVRYNTHEEYEKNELRENIYAAIDGLSGDARAVIIATEFEGRSFRELSETWDVPVGTLLARKSRAMKKIREKLGEYMTQGGYQ